MFSLLWSVIPSSGISYSNLIFIWSAIVLLTTLILIMHLSIFSLYKCTFYYLLCMLCDKICYFTFVCRSKSPTGLMLHCRMYSTQNKSSMSMYCKSTTIQDKCLTEENEILNKWTDRYLYCSDLYNYKTDGDPIVLDCPQIPDEGEHHPILRVEVEAAVKALKMGKSAGVDNIQSELVKAGGEAMIDILASFCNKIWKTGEWPTTWT